MKNIILIISFFSFYNVFSQYNPDAPWMESLNDKHKKTRAENKFTFNQITNSFNNYWVDKDISKKGNGYKPFKRWENYWKSFVKENGTLPTSKELWSTWQKAQQIKQRNSHKIDTSNWQPVGPFSYTNTGSRSPGLGRVNAIIVDPNTPTTYYAGAPAGGIWKSTDSGGMWTPLSDDLPQIGVSGIAIDYNDSDIIYIATGDDDNDDSYSVGVMKSIDGGVSWNLTDLNPNNSPTSMNDIYMNPSNSSMLWVATNNGVYKTMDGGINWSNLNGTEGLNIKDIKLKPGDPNTIYAVSSNTLYVSTNAGDTFTNTGFGVNLPASSNRLVIDVTPHNSNVIYVLSALNNSFQGLYKSSDSGVNFTKMAANLPATIPGYDDDLFDHTTQANYDMALAVSDANENEIYVGTLNIWKSINSGANFTKVNDWSKPNLPSYTHADIHLLRFYNGNLFAGTDGGFYKTTDGGINFTDLTSGMQIGQFYRLSISKESSQKVVGGLQDNGGFAFNNSLWQNYYGGDGMDTAIDPFNSNYMFGFIQYGNLLYASSTAGANRSFTVAAPDAEKGANDNGGNWVTPLSMNRDGELYAGYSSLYKLCGGYWSKISPSFGANNNIDVLELDPLNPNNIYVSLNNVLHKSTNKGVSFSSIYTFTQNIMSIEVNNNNSDIIYVTTSGLTGGVFKSTNGGTSFNSITGSLPSVTKNIIKHQNLHSQNPLFLGTNLGVYRYDDIIADWEPFENNLPTVAVSDLEINVNDSNITASTYGRGVWKSTIPTESLSDEISLESIVNAKAAVTCGSINTAKALVKNNGTNTVSSINVEYTLNGVTNNTVWNGTLASKATTLINIPSIPLSNAQLQNIQIKVSAANDLFLGNNELRTSFFANKTGLPNTVNSFEDSTDALLVFDESSTCSGYWERGAPTGTLLNTAPSGTNVYGTNLSGNYSNNTKSYLTTNCYDLSLISNPLLKFNMAFDLELNWDILYVEYTTDSGISWNVLGSAADSNWYNSSATPGTNCHSCPGAQWTGADTTIKEYSYSLASLNTETNIIFRFVFHSDQATVREGVIIDDFIVEGQTVLNTSTFNKHIFTIYPNPSKNIFNIKTNIVDSFSFNITDITGKSLLKKSDVKAKNGIYKIDMSHFNSGIYFLNLFSEKGNSIKKLILR